MEQTKFIHVWEYKDGTKRVMEQPIATTLEVAIDQYKEDDIQNFEYKYTLHILGDLVREMDIRDFITKKKGGG